MPRNRATMKRFLLPLATLFALVSVSSAQVELDTDQEQRAEALFAQLRCVVCQNQSILESDADVAKDLRTIVSEQIEAGKTDAEIKTFLVDRYGEFVLLRPVFSTHTLVLWMAPILFVLLGLFLVWRAFTRKVITADHVELSDEEEKRLNELLDNLESKR